MSRECLPPQRSCQRTMRGRADSLAPLLIVECTTQDTPPLSGFFPAKAAKKYEFALSAHAEAGRPLHPILPYLLPWRAVLVSCRPNPRYNIPTEYMPLASAHRRRAKTQTAHAARPIDANLVGFARPTRRPLSPFPLRLTSISVVSTRPPLSTLRSARSISLSMPLAGLVIATEPGTVNPLFSSLPGEPGHYMHRQ